MLSFDNSNLHTHPSILHDIYIYKILQVLFHCFLLEKNVELQRNFFLHRSFDVRNMYNDYKSSIRFQESVPNVANGFHKTRPIHLIYGFYQTD